MNREATASERGLVVAPRLVLESQRVMFEIWLERRMGIEVRRMVRHHLVPLDQGQHLGGWFPEGKPADKERDVDGST